MARMNQTLTYAVRFAQFAAEHKLHPRDLAELVTLINASVRAYERADSYDGMKRYNKATDAVDAKAKEIGLQIDWPGLYPTVGSGHPVPCC